MKSFSELLNQIPEQRRKRIESYVSGFKARYAKVPLTDGIADHDWRDGWSDADEAILAEGKYGVPATTRSSP